MNEFNSFVAIALVVVIAYVVYSQQNNAESYRRPRKPTRFRKVDKPSWGGRHLSDTGMGAYGFGGSGSGGYVPHPPSAAAKYGAGGETYHWKPQAREMYRGQGKLSKLVQPMGSTPQTNADWIQANANARAYSAPRTSLHSQFTAPVVSSLNPHEYDQNPQDPFLDDILFQVSAFRNRRNVSYDPRGQIYTDPNALHGIDQLVPIRTSERLATHGKSHQIQGCTEMEHPRY